MSKGKLIHGVGYNSGGYPTHHEGKAVIAYTTWVNMLKRCYSEASLRAKPTHIGCSVDPKWLDYQLFAMWYTTHPHYKLGYYLDKDILVVGNKVYSPDTCSLVPHRLNSLLNSQQRKRGALPQGIHQHGNCYRVKLSVRGKQVNLGNIKTLSEAVRTYKQWKEAYVADVALEFKEHITVDVYNALINWRLP